MLPRMSMAQMRRAKSPWQLWRDAGGRLSALRIGTLALLFLPVAIAIHDYVTVGFGPRPINDVIHRTGYWALLFLLISLAVTPLRRIARFGRLIDVRRMIGVGAFVYALAHILLYVADQKYDLWKVGSEIVLRLYLTIGFITLLGLAVLAATSTDQMVRRLGGMRWQRLHQIVYALALLALIHFFQQTKADVWVPTFVAGLFGWLMGYRLLIWRKTERGELSAWMLTGLSVAVAALTIVAEAVGIGIVCTQLAAGLHYWPLQPLQFALALTGPLYALTSFSSSITDGVPVRSASVEPGVILLASWAAALLIR